jgi:hypothetical protein
MTSSLVDLRLCVRRIRPSLPPIELRLQMRRIRRLAMSRPSRACRCCAAPKTNPGRTPGLPIAEQKPHFCAELKMRWSSPAIAIEQDGRV